ncbi:hypothetical protein EI94DRAFT_1809904 [Lactarius quietus]|nr:hypothetical protein EI94DRAFT_1809904 [Lactarius quietus]
MYSSDNPGLPPGGPIFNYPPDVGLFQAVKGNVEGAPVVAGSAADPPTQSPVQYTQELQLHTRPFTGGPDLPEHGQNPMEHDHIGMLQHTKDEPHVTLFMRVTDLMPVPSTDSSYDRLVNEATALEGNPCSVTAAPPANNDACLMSTTTFQANFHQSFHLPAASPPLISKNTFAANFLGSNWDRSITPKQGDVALAPILSINTAQAFFAVTPYTPSNVGSPVNGHMNQVWEDKGISEPSMPAPQPHDIGEEMDGDIANFLDTIRYPPLDGEALASPGDPLVEYLDEDDVTKIEEKLAALWQSLSDNVLGFVAYYPGPLFRLRPDNTLPVDNLCLNQAIKVVLIALDTGLMSPDSNYAAHGLTHTLWFWLVHSLLGATLCGALRSPHYRHIGHSSLNHIKDNLHMAPGLCQPSTHNQLMHVMGEQLMWLSDTRSCAAASEGDKQQAVEEARNVLQRQYKDLLWNDQDARQSFNEDLVERIVNSFKEGTREDLEQWRQLWLEVIVRTLKGEDTTDIRAPTDSQVFRDHHDAITAEIGRQCHHIHLEFVEEAEELFQKMVQEAADRKLAEEGFNRKTILCQWMLTIDAETADLWNDLEGSLLHSNHDLAKMRLLKIADSLGYSQEPPHVDTAEEEPAHPAVPDDELWGVQSSAHNPTNVMDTEPTAVVLAGVTAINAQLAMMNQKFGEIEERLGAVESGKHRVPVTTNPHPPPPPSKVTAPPKPRSTEFAVRQAPPHLPNPECIPPSATIPQSTGSAASPDELAKAASEALTADFPELPQAAPQTHAAPPPWREATWTPVGWKQVNTAYAGNSSGTPCTSPPPARSSGTSPLFTDVMIQHDGGLVNKVEEESIQLMLGDTITMLARKHLEAASAYAPPLMSGHWAGSKEHTSNFVFKFAGQVPFEKIKNFQKALTAPLGHHGTVVPSHGWAWLQFCNTLTSLSDGTIPGDSTLTEEVLRNPVFHGVTLIQLAHWQSMARVPSQPNATVLVCILDPTGAVTK